MENTERDKLNAQVEALADWFYANKERLTEQYEDKFVLINMQHEVTPFETLSEAIEAGDRLYGEGYYSVHKCAKKFRIFTGGIRPVKEEPFIPRPIAYGIF